MTRKCECWTTTAQSQSRFHALATSIRFISLFSRKGDPLEWSLTLPLSNSDANHVGFSLSLSCIFHLVDPTLWYTEQLQLITNAPCHSKNLHAPRTPHLDNTTSP